MTWFSILSVVAGATLLSLSACQTRRLNSSLTTADPGREPLTACLGIQGNGTNFSSHMGTLIGLFENNIEPKVVIGGSSGAIVGSIGRALMLNKSILDPNNRVMYPGKNGEFFELGYPQKAALILAASEEVMNGFLFVPAFDEHNSLKMYLDLLRFGNNLAIGRQLPSDPRAKILNIEPTVGSAVLLTAFFQLTDFTDILQAAAREFHKSNPNFLEEFNRRRVAVEKKFLEYVIPDPKSRADDMKWSFAEVLALMSDPTVVLRPFGLDLGKFLSGREGGVRKERLEKLKTLFAEDSNFVNEFSTQENIQNHENFYSNPVTASLYYALYATGLGLNNIARFFNALENKSLTPDDLAVKEFLKHSLVRVLNGKFWVADPNLIHRAYSESVVPNPQNPKDPIFFPVPDGMIIHSTFRSGVMVDDGYYVPEWNASLGSGKAIRLKTILDFREKPGFDNLFQGYIVGAPLDLAAGPESYFEQMLERRNKSWSKLKDATQSNSGTVWDSEDLSQLPFLPYDAASLQRADRRCLQAPVKTFGNKIDPCQSEDEDKKVASVQAYIPPSRILLFDQQKRVTGVREGAGISMASRGLNFGIRVSAAEPGAFRRYGIPVTESDRKINSSDGMGSDSLLVLNASRETIQLEANEKMEQVGLVGFGGWSENVPLSAVAHLKECQSAQIFVSSAKNAPGNDFQAGALLAAINGRYYNSVNPQAQNNLQLTKSLFRKLNATVEFSRSLYGGDATDQSRLAGSASRKIWLSNDMDFDSPCELARPEKCQEKEKLDFERKIKSLNSLIIPFPWGDSRFPMALVGYQKTVQSIRQAPRDSSESVVRGLQDRIGQFNAFGQFIADPAKNIATMSDEIDVARFVTNVSQGKSVQSQSP